MIVGRQDGATAISTSTKLRHAIGSAFGRAEHGLLAAPAVPLTRYFPAGRSWLYDIARYSGSRDIGVALDVGANVGQTAHQLIRYLPKARIVCFEPTPTAFDALKSAYSDRVECVAAAIGRETGTASLKLHEDSQLNSFATVRTGQKQTDTVDVPVYALDDYCGGHGITQIDILKMDVQGWEMEVLAGAQGLLSSGRVRFVYAEVGFRSRDTDMQSFGELNAHMDALGYEFCGLYEPFRWGRSKAFLGFANALYALPSKS